MPERETLGRLLRAARDRLQAASIEDASIEAELLMRQALRGEGKALPTKAWLLPRLGQTATDPVRDTFAALVQRRLQHEPSAYITGVREFGALEFEVTPDVLIPRPETELLVSTAVGWAAGASGSWSPYPATAASRSLLQGRPRERDPLRIGDVGTGSGAIAVALARRLPAASIIATDVSWGALAVASRNARRHGMDPRIGFRHGDLLLPVNCYVDLIVANLPYVPEGDWRALEPEVRDHEPSLALDGGEDGLDVIRVLLHQTPRYLRPGGAVCLEFGAGQAETLEAFARASLPDAVIEVFDDFSGIPRVMLARH